MMYTMPKNLLSICVNFTLATQRAFRIFFCPPHTGGGAGLCKIRVKSVSLV